MRGSISYIYSRFGFTGVINAARAKLTRSSPLLKVDRPGIRFPFHLRCRTSDLSTFDQIFTEEEYDCVVTRAPRVIVDAGANIGLASIYFANRFVESRIVALEPEITNFKILVRNVAPYPNIIAIQAALWNEDDQIELIDPGRDKWGFVTVGKQSPDVPQGRACHKVRAMTVDTLMREHRLEHIDILKMDIEGAEREVFADPSAWLERVDALIVELHDSIKPGCRTSFSAGATGFDYEWKQGENIFMTRGRWLTRRASAGS